MTAPSKTAFSRVTVGLFAGGVGALSCVIAQAIWSYRDEYISTPSMTWAATGAVIGFMVGACYGDRPLSGRTAWLATGCVAGIAVGSVVGWCWARVEFAADRRRLLVDGIPAEFVDDSKIGLFTGHYEGIGLRYGASLGFVTGLVTGYCWKRNLRQSFMATIAIAAALCIVIAGAIAMECQFGRLSMRNLADLRSRWNQERDRLIRVRDAELPQRTNPGTGH